MTNGCARNPFPGLRAFEPDEDYLFFGRETETDELRKRLRTARFLAVIGSSGSGKSSLVKSGLIPSLRAGFMAGAGSGWRIATLRPGEDPIGNLVRALRQSQVVPALSTASSGHDTVLDVTLRDSSLGVAEAVKQAMLPPGENVLVVVDQFEELFRFKRSRISNNSDNESIAFVKLLLDAVRQDYVPLFVVITMRSEFIGDCMPFPGLPESINEGLYLIPRMTRDETRAAITKPVAVAGGSIAPRLVIRLLNESADEPDRLPVLQHALTRTWDEWARDHRTGEPIDVRHYEAIGTLKTALSNHADEAYEDAGRYPRGKAIAERLFKTITDTTEEGRGVRRPEPLSRIAAICRATEAEVVEVIELFRQPGRAFLQPPESVPLDSGSIIDISHESLMRLWQRLIGWTQEEARSTEVYHRLARSAGNHAAGQESLWRNPELAIGLRWREQNHPDAAWTGDPADFEQSMRFLDRSRNAHRFRRGVMIAALAGVMLLLAGWGYRQYEENLLLQAEVARLTGLKSSESAQTQETAQRVQQLRTEHEALMADIGTATAARDQLTAANTELRKRNAGAEDAIKALNQENTKLNGRILDLQNQQAVLEREASELETLASTLPAQTSALSSQKDRLTSEAAAIRARRSRLEEEARQLGYVYPATATPGRESLLSQLAVEASIPQLAKIPADIAENDVLRKKISDLQNQIAALRASRAKQENEVKWLNQENPLLRQQKDSLGQEVARLKETNAKLQRRAADLQSALELAQSQNSRLKQQADRMDAGLQTVRATMEKLRKSTADIREKNNSLVADITRLQRQIDHDNSYIRLSLVCINDAIARVTKAATAPSTNPDLAGLLAVSALHLTPDDPDDTSNPAVYNLLWRALERLDPQAAANLIVPNTAAKGKIGTTTAATLAGQICSRITRPLARNEFAVAFPPQSEFDAWSNPCASK